MKITSFLYAKQTQQYKITIYNTLGITRFIAKCAFSPSEQAPQNIKDSKSCWWSWQAAVYTLQTRTCCTKFSHTRWAYLQSTIKYPINGWRTSQATIICKIKVHLNRNQHFKNIICICSHLRTEANIKSLQHSTFWYSSFNSLLINIARLKKPNCPNANKHIRKQITTNTTMNQRMGCKND